MKRSVAPIGARRAERNEAQREDERTADHATRGRFHRRPAEAAEASGARFDHVALTHVTLFPYRPKYFHQLSRTERSVISVMRHGFPFWFWCDAVARAGRALNARLRLACACPFSLRLVGEGRLASCSAGQWDKSRYARPLRGFGCPAVASVFAVMKGIDAGGRRDSRSPVRGREASYPEVPRSVACERGAVLTVIPYRRLARGLRARDRARRLCACAPRLGA